MPCCWQVASMPQQLTIRVRPRLALVAVLLLVAFVATTARTATAATPLTVAQAVATQNNSVQTVRGYIVGEPVATSTVNRSGFTDDVAAHRLDAVVLGGDGLRDKDGLRPADH